MASRRTAAGDLGLGLGRAGGRSGPALPAAGRGAHRPVRPAPVHHQRRVAGAAALRPSRLRPRGARHRRAGRHQLFLHGCDVSRDASGDFLVNADWTQAPSGAGYALADRRVVAHVIPDLYERIGPRPASPWAQALRLALIDAAPESAEEPVVVVLSPGIHSETAFDQAYLARRAGLPVGGERRPGGPRRQAVDAVAGHAQARRRGVAPRRRRLRRPAGPAGRFPARRRRTRRGAASRRGHRRQHPGQRHPGKPWAASLPARAGRAAARRDAAVAHRRRCTGAASTWSARTC